MNFKETLEFLYERYKELGLLGFIAAGAFAELLKIAVDKRITELESGLIIDPEYEEAEKK